MVAAEQTPMVVPFCALIMDPLLEAMSTASSVNEQAQERRSNAEVIADW
jgi:hypothetical protein